MRRGSAVERYDWAVQATGRLLSGGLLADDRLRTARGHAYVDAFLDLLEVDVEVAGTGSREAVGASRRRIVVANHPTGILDGLAILHYLLPERSDVRVVASDLAQAISYGRLDDLLISVALRRRRRNFCAARQIIDHLDREGAVVLFPAGTVAAASRETGQPYTEGPWDRTLGKLALRYQADVTPVFISGRNSRLFYTIRECHHRWSTLMLLRELRMKHGETVVLRVGDTVPWEELRERETSGESATGFLRARTLALGKDMPVPFRLASGLA